MISGFPAVELYSDRWTCVVAQANAEVGDQITLRQLAELPWVAYLRAHDAPVARQLSMLGVEPRVQVSVDNFQLLPAMVAGTRRVAMVQGLLAERLGLQAGIRVLDCPFEAVPVREAMWWHPVHTHDAGHLWLRETAALVGATVTERGGG
jgi:DNA-binding transcriptional LysR family regulator